MTKVSPFLRQEMAGSVGLIAEAVICFATSSKNWHAVWALAVLLRGSLTIESECGVEGPDNPLPVFHGATWLFNPAAELRVR
jgi:hypothetical protein